MNIGVHDIPLFLIFDAPSAQPDIPSKYFYLQHGIVVEEISGRGIVDDVITTRQCTKKLFSDKKKIRVYSFSYFKYGIYKPREVKKNPIKKRVRSVVINNIGKKIIWKVRQIRCASKYVTRRYL